tara:strand:- start:854 stop:1633 length:780 start_codon:yes stop_codon:yes gene_type:complete
MFPKIIHQSWGCFTDNDFLTSNQVQWSNTWKQLNLSYEYKLWNKQQNDNLISSHYSDYKEAYDSYDREIKRVDFVRSCYMHKYGGIYADLDFECLKSFDPLLEEYSEYDVILGEMWTDDSEGAPEATNRSFSIPNALMISKAGSDFWLHYMNFMINSFPEATVEFCTGPVALRNAYLSYPNKEKILILPKEYFFPLSWVQVLNRSIGSRISDSRGLRNSALSGTITEQQKQDNFPDAYAVTYWDEGWKSESAGDGFLPV